MHTGAGDDPPPGDGEIPTNAGVRVVAAASETAPRDVDTVENDGIGSVRDADARVWLRRQTLPPLALMMMRGAVARCPVCGEGHLHDGYLRLVPRCSACGAPLGSVRADDAPPYFTIFITAHIIIALVVLTTHDSRWPIWSLIAVFVPLTLFVALLLLRPVKGATVGVMLKLGLIGEHRDDNGT